MEQLSEHLSPTEVYLARGPGGRDVVLKRLRSQQDEEASLRLRLEGDLLKRLGGRRHLVSCLGIISQPLTIVLEFLPGGSLLDAIHPQGVDHPPQPLDLNGALRIAEAVGDALDHLHSNGIVHRDVKSSNVLFGADGEPRLIDLGVAAWGEPTRGLPDGWIEEEIGTLGYAAPELLRDPSKASPQTDVYGLGVVVYEMLTGRLPFMPLPGEDDDSLRRRISAGDAPIPIDRDPAVPATVGHVVMRALARAPHDRFLTVEDFVRALLGQSQ